MASNNLFEGLGNLGSIFGGIAKSVVSKDTAEGKLLAAQSQLVELEKQEADLLLEIGRQAYTRDPESWPQDANLKLIAQNMATARATLNEAQQAQAQAEAAKAAEDAKGRCAGCGHKNPDGTRFCQECGTPLAVAPKHCTSCGAQLEPGVRFCGACGARQE